MREFRGFKRCTLLIVSVHLLSGCSVDDQQTGMFVSTKNQNDTLILLEGSKYKRIVSFNDTRVVDYGKWYYEENRLWFNDWVNRGETNNSYNRNKKKLVSFSLDKSLFGNINEIYFDVDNYYYYGKVK